MTSTAPAQTAITPNRLAAGAGVIVLLTLLAYAPAMRAGFVWDDQQYVSENPLLSTVGGLWRIWSSPGESPQYYPLVFTTFWLEARLWGSSAAGFHVVNILLHAAGALLLWRVLRQLEVPGAWLAATVFALHPVHAESVAWITERKNVLSGFFYFLAALSYLKFDKTSRYRYFGITMVLFLLALFSKTITASLPIALGLILWYRGRSFSRSRIITLASMIGLGFIMGMLTRFYEYRHVANVDSANTLWTAAERILVAGRAFWFYPYKFIWPFHLSFSYDPWAISTAILWQWLFPLAVVAVGALLFLLFHRGAIGRGPVTATLFYAATIFPALGFVKVAYMRYTPVSDHFPYLASIGVLLLVAGVGTRVLGLLTRNTGQSASRWIAGTAAVVLLGICCILSFQQAKVFHSLDTLWTHTVQQSPNSWLGRLNYGIQLKRKGDLSGAEVQFRRVMALQPPPCETAMVGAVNLSSVLFRQDRYAEALEMADTCLEMNSTFPLGLFNKGRALWKLGRLDEAERILLFLTNLQFDPDQGRREWDFRRRLEDSALYSVLAEVQLALGKYGQALESCSVALRDDPSNTGCHHARLKTLSRCGSPAQLISALRVASRDAKATIPFRLQLGWALSVAADPKDRNGQEALTICASLARELGNADALLLSTLAAALAEVGQFEQALRTAGQALEIARTAGKTELFPRITAQQHAYSNGKPLYLQPAGGVSAQPTPGPALNSATPESRESR